VYREVCAHNGEQQQTTNNKSVAAVMSSLLFVIVCWSLFCSTSLAVPKVVLECEQKAHRNLNAGQRKRLCETTTTGDYSIGPAVCSIYAKDKLRFSFEDILRLCVDAVSAAPAECFEQIDKSVQKRVGWSLCSRAESLLPAHCFRDVSQVLSLHKFPEGAKKKQHIDAVVDFCRQIHDWAPLLCVQAVQNHTSLSGLTSLSLCSQVTGSGDGSLVHPLNTLVSTCIAVMSVHVQSMPAVSFEDVVTFCAQINHRQHARDVISLESELLSFSSASVDCFETLLASVQDTMTYSGPTLSGKQLMAICTNAPVALGPVNCTLDTVDKVKQREKTLKLQADQLIALCKGAATGGPSDCFVDSKGIGSVDERAQLCHGASNAGPSQCFRRANNLFRKDPENKMVLCVMAESEGPAACAAVGKSAYSIQSSGLNLETFYCLNCL
jgi:hypothetical protein